MIRITVSYPTAGKRFDHGHHPSQPGMGAHGKAILGDIPNHTDIAPAIVISEMK